MKKLVLLVLVLALSGCVYPKDSILQLEYSSRFSFVPSRDNPSIVLKGTNYDYVVPFIPNFALYGTWRNKRNGEILSFHRDELPDGTYESRIETASAMYGIIFISPKHFLVPGKSPEFDTYFEIVGYKNGDMILGMNLQGTWYFGTWERVTPKIEGTT